MEQRQGRRLAMNIALAVVATAALVALVEFASCAALSRRSPDPEIRELTELYPLEDHPDYGWVLRPSIAHRAVKALAGGKICYDVTYHTDALRRRTVSQRHETGSPHVILFGCSTALGEGLPDEQTLQFLLGQRLPDHDIYDYAVHGYGPSHMLAQLESGELPAQIPSRRGRALYLMIPEHVSRVTGDTRAFWAYRGPYYALDQGGVARRRSFETGRPFTTALYRRFLDLKRHSKFLTLIDLQLPPRIPEDALELTARVVIRSRDLYQAQFDGPFAVVFHPSWNLGHAETAARHAWFLRRFSAAGIEVLDHARPRPLGADEQVDPDCDHHPSGRLNAGLAAAIAADLGGGTRTPRHAILILLDAARADRFSTYGYRRETTPHLDALGARGVVFLRHFTQGAETRTALPTLLYSRYYARPLFPSSEVVPYSEPRDLFLGPDPEAVSLPRALAREGFHTALVSAHPWLQPQTLFAREFDEVHSMRDIEAWAGAAPAGEHRYFYPRAEQVISFAIDWIERNAEKDFFLYLHLMDTHTPHFLEEDARGFLAPGDLERIDTGRFQADGYGPREPERPLTEPERRYLDALYDGSLRYADRQLGRLFAHLEQSGDLDRSLIAVTSDHGENLLEVPGRLGHAGDWNDAVARVPLILFHPPGLAPARVTEFSEGVDLLPTLLGLLGVRLPAPERADGVDLRAVLRGEIPPRERVFTARALRSAGHKCVFASADAVLRTAQAPPPAALEAELYDLERDPLETRNLWASAPALAADCVAAFRERMAPLHRRYLSTRTGEPPPVPFAIATNFFDTPQALPRLEAGDLEQAVARARGRWVRFQHWQDFFLLAGQGAPPLRIEFEIPNGRYRLSAGVLGSGTIRFPDPGETVRFAGPALSDASWIEGARADEVDWKTNPVELGELVIGAERLRAEIEPDPRGGPLLVRQLGFTPVPPGAPAPERDEDLVERLRGLGYVP